MMLKDGRPVFGWEFRKAFLFNTREAAETAITDFMIPNMSQQTDENYLWNYGYMLTVMEVFV
jgi:hypothetical protein